MRPQAYLPPRPAKWSWQDGNFFAATCFLRPPRHSRTVPTSQEKEWFASDDRNFVGTVVEDLVDHDWFYVLLRRGRDNRLENVDMGFNIPERMTARQRLLDCMAAERRGQHRSGKP
jgi:hypothetical protein